EGDRLVIDLEGSAPQNRGPVNCGLPATLAACRIAFKALTNPAEPACEGDFAPLELRVPDDCMFNARYPAPTFVYETDVLTDVVLRALSEALPGRVAAAHYGNLAGFMLAGRGWIHQEPEVGGWGASVETDGERALI